MDSPTPASVPASVPAQPAQNTPIAPISAVPTSAATDLVTSVLGQHFNPTTGGVNPPSVVPVDVPVQPPAPQPVATPPAVPVQPADTATKEATPPPQSVPASPPAVTDMDFQADPMQRYAEPQAPNPFADPIPEIPDESQLQLPDDPNDRGSIGRAFAQARYEAKQYRQLATQLRERLVEASKLDQSDQGLLDRAVEVIQNSRDRIENLEAQLGRLDLTKSKRFSEEYDAPIGQTYGNIVEELQSSGYNQTDAESIAETLLTTRDREIVDKIFNGLTDLTRGKISYQAKAFYEAVNRRNQAIENWREQSAKYNEQEPDPVQYRKDLCERGLDRISSVVKFWDDPAFVRYRDGGAYEAARKFISSADSSQLMTAAIEGALVAPFAYQQIAKLQQANAKLTRRLQASGRLSAPGVAPFFQSAPAPVPPPPAPAEPVDESGGDPVRAAEQMVRNTFARLTNTVN